MFSCVQEPKLSLFFPLPCFLPTVRYIHDMRHQAHFLLPWLHSRRLCSALLLCHYNSLVMDSDMRRVAAGSTRNSFFSPVVSSFMSGNSFCCAFTDQKLIGFSSRECCRSISLGVKMCPDFWLYAFWLFLIFLLTW